ncbi:MAG: zinc transporter ZupT [Spirochaetales bacterium]|nr:zinc transporter ZupT [Spirochaetales bacterium]
MEQEVLLAFGLTLMAGLATGVGSVLAFFARKTNTRFLSVALGFSAGVMIYVSMIEIFPKGMEEIAGQMGPRPAAWLTVVSFFGGIAVIALIDRLVPKAENPHEVRRAEEMARPAPPAEERKLIRMGAFAALAIGIHNFPEGLATFMATLEDPSVGIAIAVAIGIHNIPEGIAVAVPIYYATGSRRKAFKYSFLSGVSEPLGALIGYLILLPIMSDLVMGVLFAVVSGIMVFISLDELLPAAREYGEHHYAIGGLVAGMAVMAVSLVLL